MIKYAVLVTMDLDIELMDDVKPSEVEKKTENYVRIAIETKGSGGRGVGEIRMLRTKLLGLAKE